MFEKRAVAGRKAPSAQTCMGNEEPIERIMGPANAERLGEPRRRRRIVLQPSAVRGQVGHGSVPLQSQTAALYQKLDLEQTRRRDVQPRAGTRQRRGSSVMVLHPDEGVRVEKNHRRRDRPLKVSPLDDQLQVHCPSATAGSRISIRGRRDRRVRGRTGSAHSTNRVPRRSMTTGSPRSAVSSISASRDRSSELLQRFICTLYNVVRSDSARRARSQVRRARLPRGSFAGSRSFARRDIGRQDAR